MGKFRIIVSKLEDQVKHRLQKLFFITLFCILYNILKIFILYSYY